MQRVNKAIVTMQNHNYELAKLLKEAGFPQFGKGTWTYPPDKIVVHSSDRVYDPTLSELIDACGETFGSLRRVGVTDWQTEDCSYTGSGPVFCGSSPEAAVARLWLALHDATAHAIARAKAIEEVSGA